MKPSEFLFEAEQNIKKAKANQYLGQLSDADLAMVASLLQGSLEEGVQDLMTQKKAGKRIDGRPSDFVAYDDTNQTAKRYLETNNGLQVTDARYSPPPRGYTPPTQTASATTPQPEVKSFVASLDNKEKEALLNVVKKEAKKRKSEPKKAEPKKSSSGKIVAGVLAGLLALSVFTSSDKLETPQGIIQQINNNHPVTGFGKNYTVTSWLEGDKKSPHWQSWMGEKSPVHHSADTYVTIKNDDLEFHIKSSKSVNYNREIKYYPGSQKIFFGKITKKSNDTIESEKQEIGKSVINPLTKKSWTPISIEKFILNLNTKEFKLVRTSGSLDNNTKKMLDSKGIQIQEWQGNLDEFKNVEFEEKKDIVMKR